MVEIQVPSRQVMELSPVAFCYESLKRKTVHWSVKRHVASE